MVITGNPVSRSRTRRDDEDYSETDDSNISDEASENADDVSRNDSSTQVTDGAAAMKSAGMGSSRTFKEIQCMMVKKTVSKNTLLYCPFVNNNRELAHNRPFAKITMGFLGKKKLSEEDKCSFWEEYKHTAHKALNIKRSNISGMLRKRFVGK